MALSILASALMFWSDKPMPWYIEAVFLFMFGMTSLVGLAMFFIGFRQLREYKIVTNTPRMPIRSVALGLVHIGGQAQPDVLIPSPVTYTPCCLYRVKVEEWRVREEEEDGETRQVGRWEESWLGKWGTRFYLADDTGKALIEAGRPNEDYELEEYSRHLLGSDSPKAREISQLAEAEFDKLLRPKQTEGIDSANGILHLGEESQPQPSEQLRVLDTVRNDEILRRGGNDYRLTEFLVLPQQRYEVIGTCVENTDPKRDDDRNFICKTSALPFVIASGGADMLRPKNLRRTFIWNIVGGAVLTVIGLGFLLLFIAWLLNGQVPLNAQTQAQISGLQVTHI